MRMAERLSNPEATLPNIAFNRRIDRSVVYVQIIRLWCCRACGPVRGVS